MRRNVESSEIRSIDLSDEEVDEYIRHRLLVAGAPKQIFNLNAVKQIFHYSRGYPRLINIICDRALMTAYASGETAITAAMVDECARELDVALGDSTLSRKNWRCKNAIIKGV